MLFLGWKSFEIVSEAAPVDITALFPIQQHPCLELSDASDIQFFTSSKWNNLTLFVSIFHALCNECTPLLTRASYLQTRVSCSFPWMVFKWSVDGSCSQKGGKVGMIVMYFPLCQHQHKWGIFKINFKLIGKNGMQLLLVLHSSLLNWRLKCPSFLHTGLQPSYSVCTRLQVPAFGQFLQSPPSQFPLHWWWIRFWEFRTRPDQLSPPTVVIFSVGQSQSPCCNGCFLFKRVT